MPAYHHRKALGVEFDAHGARAVLVRRRHDDWRIEDVLHLPWQQEGILSEAEQQHAIREWLQEHHLGGYACCGGLPQTEVNTVISDFPPVHNREQLSRMVEYQARQLDSFSEEQFHPAFQALIPLPGQTNPLLIAMSRESVLTHRLQQFQAMGLEIEQMTSTGLALLNAFETLQAAAAEEPALQLVADFGAENSVLAIYCQGRVQLVTTIAAGFHADANALSSFAREIREVLQSWKATQIGEIGLMTPSQLWLSGAGALSSEAADFLANALQLPVRLLGLPARKCAAGLPTGGAIGGVCPAVTLAFGLALQGTGTAPCSLSLIPPRLAWQQRRKKASPYLALTAILLAIALAAGLHLFNVQLQNSFTKLQLQESVLDESLQLAPRLDHAYQQLDYHQKRLLPIAESGFRTQRYMETLQVWNNAIPDHSDQETWCFYLADEFSFTASNTTQAAASNSGSRRSRDEEGGERGARTRNSVTADSTPPLRTTQVAVTEPPAAEKPAEAAQGDSETAENAEAAPQAAVVYPPAVSPTQIPFLSTMYIGGFVPAISNKYQLLKKMQERLNLSETFVNVDDYADFLTADFQKAFLQPWKEFLAEHHDAIGQEQLLFFLQLPFHDAPVKRPAN